MKTKLLKKIRKRFSIEYYPNISSVYKYVITDHEKGDTLNDPFSRHRITKSHKTKDEALETIFYICYKYYKQYSRKYKLSVKCNKVWYNG